MISFETIVKKQKEILDLKSENKKLKEIIKGQEQIIKILKLKCNAGS